MGWADLLGRSPRERSGLALASPVVAFLLAFFVVPAVILLLYSLWTSEAFVVTPDLTAESYARALGSQAFWRSLWTGVVIGFWTAAIAVAASFPVAWHVVYRSRSNALLYAVLLSWFLSYLVRIYAWRTILGTRGLINSTLLQAGLIDEPLGFLIFSTPAVVLTLVHVFVPFTLLLQISALRNVSRDYVEAARDLGATGPSMLLKVVVPMAYGGIVGSFMFTFILAASDFITPQLLGGRESVTTGLLISNQFRQTGNWPLGAAMAFLLLATFLLAYLAVAGLMRAGRLAPGVRFHPATEGR